VGIASPDLHAGLFFNAAKRSGWNVSFRMGHRHTARTRGVLEPPMIPFGGDMNPSGSFDSPDYVTAVHLRE
jgi:hypothetical protein